MTMYEIHKLREYKILHSDMIKLHNKIISEQENFGKNIYKYSDIINNVEKDEYGYMNIKVDEAILICNLLENIRESNRRLNSMTSQLLSIFNK